MDMGMDMAEKVIIPISPKKDLFLNDGRKVNNVG